jgi:hypothetical protein
MRPTHEPSSQKNHSRSAKDIPSGHGIPGYSYGQGEVASSPLTLHDVELLKQTVLWTEDDTKYMQMSLEALKDQTDDILDVWTSFIAVYPHLSVYFAHRADQKTNKEYLAAVRMRFKQWIIDTAKAEYDQDWLNYQQEIALRHHRAKKNQTDHADANAVIHFRYIPAFIYPITATLKPFLFKKHLFSAEDVECMHQAWIKAVILQVCLWSQPYVKEGDY